MAKSGVDDFLGEPVDPAVEPVAVEAVAPEIVSPEPPAVDPNTEVEPLVAKVEETAPEAEDKAGVLKALQAVRREKNDYKGERDRLQGEIDAIRAELAEARKAREQAPQQVAVQQPVPQAVPRALQEPDAANYNFSIPEDVRRYNVDMKDFLRAENQQARWNDRLNDSEVQLRRDKSDVDETIAIFKQAAAQNPALAAQLPMQPDPYRWAYDQAKRMQAMEKIGPDPDAYERTLREKIEAEYAAKYAAPATAAIPTNPVVQLPTSLAAVRSAAPRDVPGDNVATDFDDILKPLRRRG